MRLLLASFAALLLPASTAAAAITRGWSSVGDMADIRAGHSAVLLEDGRVLVAGGFDFVTSGSLRTAELFDPATGKWSQAQPMVRPRHSFAMVRLPGGKVLAVGGFYEDARASAEIYDPARNEWREIAGAGEQRTASGLVALSDGRVVVVGGDFDTTSQVFDPRSETWSAPVALYPGQTPNVITAALLPGDRVLSAGGYGTNEWMADAVVFNGGGWGAAAAMNAPRHAHELVPLGNGRVLAVGGSAASGPLTSTDIYDPATNTWTQGPPTRAQHDSASSTTLANGSVMVISGTTGPDTPPTPAAEVYSPATNTWTFEGTLLQPRSSNTATLLSDGRVLVTGGQDRQTVFKSAEVWTPTTSFAGANGLVVGRATIGSTGNAALQLTNTGDQPLITGGYALSGAGAADYRVNSAGCRVVAPGAACVLGVAFAPTATGARGATLAFSANTVAGSHTIGLSGTGVAVRDRDRDGIPDSADRCDTARGPRSRSGCPRGLINDPSIRYVRGSRGIRVLAYYVKATTGARVLVRCSKGCRQTVTKGRGGRRLRITRLNNRRLTNGTRITIKVSKRGRLTTTVYDRIARGRRSEGRPRCSSPGTTKPLVAC